MPGDPPEAVRAAQSRSGRRSSLARAAPGDPDGLTVVGIGASAGGLDAFRSLLNALQDSAGAAFIFVQHLAPTHESMMVDLLSSHTSMIVRQAANGMAIEPGHIYVIPPAIYLSVGAGVLQLSQPQARLGARLPFDFLLVSLAEEYGARAICVVLSGTGADGSIGLRAVKKSGGLVIAQDPDEAGYDGMPRNAIATGEVDLVLPVGRIPEALARREQGLSLVATSDGSLAREPAEAALFQIIDLLRAKTAHDFTLYKRGTLQRRIERRMAMAAIETMERYLEILRGDTRELDLLAKDLLINVTSFFRDRPVFDALTEKTIPDLIAAHVGEQPLRIWIVGCSTGEETYSLAMLFREAISAAKSVIKLQVFASDVDPDAVAVAREGLYPETIAADVSPARLARFFSKEEHGYRISPELRASVVFTIQDILSDPPFSRLDLVSCRNLLIYLGAQAQAKVIALFHFALRDGGILLLGGSETIADAEGRFEVISKSERLYRRIGRTRPGDLGFATVGSDGLRVRERARQGPPPSRDAALAELCRRLVMENYAPAAVLIDRKHECLFSVGPIERYLRLAPGRPTLDLLVMTPSGPRNKLRAAIHQASQENARVVVPGGRIDHDGESVAFSIAVHPILSEGETLMLVCFLDSPKGEQRPSRPPTPGESPRIAELERELESTRMELQGAIRNLEIAGEEQTAINEEALSVNEEYQSTNEELLTSKEELQSLNEELTALNGQLQETLTRERTVANDLQNVLYSTDVATLFLDINLNIRFFTPATKSLFNIIPSDIGRALSDLRSLAADNALLTDAASVLRNLAPLEREIESENGSWYIRRILPYRTQDNGVEGVVITFADITEQAQAADALDAAKRQAQRANVAKSRFLAAASHDLRQPLQTLALLQGLLAKTVEGAPAQKLIARVDEALSAMSGILNTLLDINQIEAGTVHVEMVSFPIDGLLDRLRDEFVYHAQANGLDLRVVLSGGLWIHSDPRLLEQMIRNLLSNAMKYTKDGKVLIGCRRRGGVLSIEVWDTGVGIPDDELQAIFEEYHQLDNVARERNRGLGLGLSIVQRLGKLLGHRISVRSRPGKGSAFGIDVVVTTGEAATPPATGPQAAGEGSVDETRRTGVILVIEDDPEVRELLELLLRDEGHHVLSAPDGATALDLAGKATVRTDLILADYNLPNDMDGLQSAAKLRIKLRRRIPVVILTGDISAEALRDIARQDYVQLNKPVKARELAQTVERLLAAAHEGIAPRRRPAEDADSPAPTIFVIDDDSHIRDAIRDVFEEDGRAVEDYATSEAFLQAYRPVREACLLVDAYLPGMSGLELLRRLKEMGHVLPAIMITGNSDVPMAVEAMKAGALDFIEKPIGRRELLASVDRALEQSRDIGKATAWREKAVLQLADLTSREREIMELVVAGRASKNIAVDLGISQRTVENHRASIMKKTGSASLPALARLAITASGGGEIVPVRPTAATPSE